MRVLLLSLAMVSLVGWVLSTGNVDLGRLGSLFQADLAEIIPTFLQSWYWSVPVWFWLVLGLAFLFALPLTRQPTRIR